MGGGFGYLCSSLWENVGEARMNVGHGWPDLNRHKSS